MSDDIAGHAAALEQSAAKHFPNSQHNAPAAVSTPPVADAKPAPISSEEAAALKAFPSMQPEAPKDDTGVPENILELREGDADRKHFDMQLHYKGVLPDDLFDFVGGEEVTAEMKQQAIREWREISADYSAPPEEVEDFKKLYSHAMQHPPSDAEMDRQYAEAVRLVKAKYGNDAKQVLELAHKLSIRDPRVGNLIKFGRIGNDPALVMKMCEKAVSEKAKGRLK